MQLYGYNMFRIIRISCCALLISNYHAEPPSPNHPRTSPDLCSEDIPICAANAHCGQSLRIYLVCCCNRICQQQCPERCRTRRTRKHPCKPTSRHQYYPRCCYSRHNAWRASPRRSPWQLKAARPDGTAEIHVILLATAAERCQRHCATCFTACMPWERRWVL